jgi:DNA-binding protein H-NS
MNFEELWVLHEELTKILVEKIAAEKLELEKRLTKLGRTDGLAAEVVTGPDGPLTIARTKVAPKYRNTSPPYETWSGRGKQPRWLKKLLDSGSNIADFKISGER